MLSFQSRHLTQPSSHPQSWCLCSLPSYLMAVQRLNRNPGPVLPPHTHLWLQHLPYLPPSRPGAVRGVILQTCLLLSSATVGLVTALLQVRCFQTSESHPALLAWMILSPRYTVPPLLALAVSSAKNIVPGGGPWFIIPSQGCPNPPLFPAPFSSILASWHSGT